MPLIQYDPDNLSPQGSIVGPLFFIIYRIDQPNYHDIVTSILYSDDTTLSIRGASAKNLFHIGNQRLNQFQLWANSNKLTISEKKKITWLFSNLKLENNLPLLKILNNPIHSNRNDRLIGVLLDDRIKFNIHIRMLCTKVSES